MRTAFLFILAMEAFAQGPVVNPFPPATHLIPANTPSSGPGSGTCTSAGAAGTVQTAGAAGSCAGQGIWGANLVAGPQTNVTAALVNTPGNVPNGNQCYYVTFVVTINGHAGLETDPGVTGQTPNCSVTVADHTVAGRIQLTNIPLGPAGTTARNIFRTVQPVQFYGQNFGLLATVSDNTTTVYTDNLDDSAIVPVTYGGAGWNTTAGTVFDILTGEPVFGYGYLPQNGLVSFGGGPPLAAYVQNQLFITTTQGEPFTGPNGTSIQGLLIGGNASGGTFQSESLSYYIVGPYTEATGNLQDGLIAQHFWDNGGTVYQNDPILLMDIDFATTQNQPGYFVLSNVISAESVGGFDTGGLKFAFNMPFTTAASAAVGYPTVAAVTMANAHPTDPILDLVTGYNANYPAAQSADVFRILGTDYATLLPFFIDFHGISANRPRTYAQIAALTLVDGTEGYMSDGNVTSGLDDTCTSGGTGASYVRLNGVLRCRI